jgi:replicative DNA helicase
MTEPRVAPHDLDSEQAILGALLLSPNALPTVAEMGLKAEHFYRPQHGTVYTVMREMEAVDAVLLVATLRKRSLLDTVGGKAQIDLLASCVPAVGHLKHYVREVIWLAELRSYIRAAQCMIEAAHDRDEARLANGLAWFRGEKPNVIKLPSRRAA